MFSPPPQNNHYRYVRDRRAHHATLATEIDAKTDELHIGNRWMGHKGLDIYDNTARMHDPLLARYHTVDPLFAEYPGQSPWSHCAANPLNIIDPDGCDTVFVAHNGDKWIIERSVVSEGNDVFMFNKNGNTTSVEISEASYGQRLEFVDVEIGESLSDLTLGVVHASGTDITGFYVVPGGNYRSNIKQKGTAILYGEYRLIPHIGNKWVAPRFTGNGVYDRAILIHHGGGIGSKLKQWTLGCFVVSSDYKNVNGQISFDYASSRDFLSRLDSFLGAHIQTDKDGRIRATFPNDLNYSAIYKHK